jgi:radical SAM protein with 4Fe4S-binding SPASM domain
MDKIVKYIYSLGGKHVHFEPIHLAGRAFQQKKFQPSPELFVKNLKKALNAAKKLDMKIIHTSYLYLMQPCINFCSSLQGRRITITPNGDLTLCLETQDEFHPFYNFLKIGEFDKLTNRFKFDWKKIRLFKRHSVENIKNCRNCFAKYICAGGCLVRNLIENESYKQPNNYFCKIRKSVLSDLILRMWKESQI